MEHWASTRRTVFHDTCMANFFVTRAVEPLERTPTWARGERELPETSPSGLQVLRSEEPRYCRSACIGRDTQEGSRWQR